MKENTFNKLKEGFENMGIILKEVMKNPNGKHDGIINYMHTNIEVKITRIDKFYDNYKNNFKLHKDVLKDTKQYKNTKLFVTNKGEVYSTVGVVKQLVLQKKNDGHLYVSCYALSKKHKKLPIHHVVLEAWGFPQPSPEHIVRHLNDIPDDNRLDNLKWDIQLINMKDKEVNEDKRKELIKKLFQANIFSLEEISILTKIKLESIEGIVKTF